MSALYSVTTRVVLEAETAQEAERWVEALLRSEPDFREVGVPSAYAMRAEAPKRAEAS